MPSGNACNCQGGGTCACGANCNCGNAKPKKGFMGKMKKIFSSSDAKAGGAAGAAAGGATTAVAGAAAPTTGATAAPSATGPVTSQAAVVAGDQPKGDNSMPGGFPGANSGAATPVGVCAGGCKCTAGQCTCDNCPSTNLKKGCACAAAGAKCTCPADVECVAGQCPCATCPKPDNAGGTGATAAAGAAGAAAVAGGTAVAAARSGGDCGCGPDCKCGQNPCTCGQKTAEAPAPTGAALAATAHAMTTENGCQCGFGCNCGPDACACRAAPKVAPVLPGASAEHGCNHLDKHRVELLEGDVLYIPDFVSATESAGWYDDLDGLPTWHHPTLRVYNRDVVQSRAVAVYATSPRDMSYSGANIETHTPLPPLLDRIRGIVERRLGGDFSTVMLNRYESGDVHIGRHSDTRDNMIIASLSLGAERTFVLSPRLPPRALKEEMSSERKRELEGRRNHEIPKERRVRGGRISLTFRQID
ncbi:hypothetical protein CspeluHIS016_0701880 [Cutaneotrichosporon spelunceum]|uniref:Fe2OG dioxygenase domain-containing protein n=1 Tax=Cutaneotrichosporon spelunceum TaxID=1672016 RepID=A0AAD3TYC3_9TREE|nr:hypothetical protein CspeluHIS016_0701880 [Cutaneotrichosporon spelunceum]